MQDKVNEINNGISDAIKLAPPYGKDETVRAIEHIVHLYRMEIAMMQGDINFLRSECEHWRKIRQYVSENDPPTPDHGRL